MRRPKSIKQLLSQGKRMQRLYPNGWPGNMRAVLYLNAKKALESIAEFVARLLFNGIDQYFTHTAWQPSGVNFDLGLTYTPAAGDIGVEKTLIAGMLTKNASDQLVVTYTDINSVFNTLTLTSVTLTADTEYNIAIISDGNGIELSAGGQSVSDTDVIDIDSLSVDTWLSSDSKLEGGDFLHGDGAAIFAQFPTISFPADYEIEIDFIWQASGGYFAADTSSLDGNDRVLISSFGQLFGAGANALDIPGLVVGRRHKLKYKRVSGQQTYYLDGIPFGSGTYTGTFELNSLMSKFGGSTSVPFWTGPLAAKFTIGSDTYEWLTANTVSDNGDGTALALNTGNTGAGFNATVQNFTPGDLVTINTRCNGVPSNLSLTDSTRLQGGDFLLFDAASIRVYIALVLTNYTAEFWFSRAQFEANRFFGNSSDLTGRAAWFTGTAKTIRYTSSSGQNLNFTSSNAGDSDDGKYHYLKITVNGGIVNMELDGEVLAPINQVVDGLPVNIDYLGVNSTSYGGGYSVAKFTDLDNGNTYEYLTNGNVIDNGNGTANAVNTGNTAPAFNGVVENFAPGDLVTLPGKSHAWPLNQAQATQDDTVGTNNGTIVNYDGGMVQ